MRLGVLFFMFAVSAIAQAQDLKKGMSFMAARKLLLAQKWQPVNVHKGTDYEYMGTENLLIKKNIVEVESCAMDRAYCVFNYKKANKCLHLTTFGEQIKDMAVVNWTNDCPDQ